jgi:aminomethyltransferase
VIQDEIILQEQAKQTPLHGAHLDLKAKMISFGGWEMPVQYPGGILSEYEATRKGVAVFDTSHMGEFLISGTLEETGLDRLVTQSLAKAPIHTCHYGLLLNEPGRVLDDLIVYRLGEAQWFIVVNAGTMEKDERHFLQQLSSRASFRNLTFQLGKLDIQGPRSRETLAKFIAGIEKLDYYTFDLFDVLGEQVIVSRTGYTGELGYEIYYPWDQIGRLWKELLRNQVTPAGLGARDILRVEMGYCLYGHELSETMSPLAAGLQRFIDWDKDFIGKTALLAERQRGISQKLRSFVAESRRSPRAGQKIFSAAQQDIGLVTSGTFSPALQKGVGLGFINSDFGDMGQDVFIGDPENFIRAQIAQKPVYRHSTLKI